MIINEKVTTTVNARTKNWFIDKGYLAVKVGHELLVSSNDLNYGSNIRVKVECDYCHSMSIKRYADYYRSVNKHTVIKKYCCSDCKQLKINEIKEYSIKNDELKIGDKGYWTIEENRINELRKYIQKYKYLDKIEDNPEGKRLSGNIRGYEQGGIKGLAQKAGYDIYKVYKSKSARKEYASLDYIVKQTNDFIEKNSRFPSLIEYKKDLKITQSSLNQYGGVGSIKSHMKYEDEADLVDDSGFYNRSLYEYIVAQFLIKNNIKYKRECHPFPKSEGRLRSDFTFYLNNNTEVHCEVWGYSEVDMHKRALQYNKSKKEKIGLYKKYKIELIQIEYEDFQQSYDLIIRKLEDIFSKYLSLNFKQLNYIDVAPPNKITDEEILNEIVKLSDDSNFLPISETVIKYNPNLYYEVMKRYDTYLNFAKKHNKQTHTFRTKEVYWTLDKVFEIYDKMIDTYGYILDKSEIEKTNTLDMEIKRVANGASKFGGMTKCRMLYYQQLLKNKAHIPESEIEYLQEVAQIKPSRRRNISSEAKQDALKLLKSIG